jgi:hypothetical protein
MPANRGMHPCVDHAAAEGPHRRNWNTGTYNHRCGKAKLLWMTLFVMGHFCWKGTESVSFTLHSETELIENHRKIVLVLLS